MWGIRRKALSYAVLPLLGLALTACGASGGGGATSSPSDSSTSASPSGTSTGHGDLQMRQVESEGLKGSEPCATAPVLPEVPTVRCDAAGAVYHLGPAFVTGAMVVSATAVAGTNGPEVDLTLDSNGGAILAAKTTTMATLGPPKGKLGVMSGGRLYEAPLVMSPVLGGSFVIAGMVNMADAVSLASAING